MSSQFATVCAGFFFLAAGAAHAAPVPWQETAADTGFRFGDAALENILPAAPERSGFLLLLYTGKRSGILIAQTTYFDLRGPTGPPSASLDDLPSFDEILELALSLQSRS